MELVRMTSQEKNLHNTADAQIWAKTFMEIWGSRLNEIDEGLMLGWFANAIEAGRDAAWILAMERFS